MCGIVGVIECSGRPVDPRVLERMNAVLGHRGPEGQGVHAARLGALSVGLGHTRLKIIDRSDAAAQPMLSDDGACWLTFNGEIYNFRELRASLQRRGVRFRSSSDTEVLLRLYEAEGERCLEQLDGMFAFAIWDGRTRRLFLARDRLGKKPLYYYVAPDFFACASEAKALLQHPGIRAEVNAEALPALFRFGYVPSPLTVYRGVVTLPPGHQATVESNGAVRVDRYWDVPHAAGTAAPTPSDAEAIGGVRELLTAAVRRRLVSDVPLGAFLSGGLDSSIVVGLMSRLCSEPVRTFSIGFANQPQFDERPYARLVARRFGATHSEYVVEPASVSLVERLVWHHDGPFADSSAIPTYLLSRLARRHVTVALTGDGGDELFAGYLRFPAALLAERMPRWSRGALHRLCANLPPWGGARGPVRRLQKFAGGACLPLVERLHRWTAVFDEDLPSLIPHHRDDGAGRMGRAAPDASPVGSDGVSALTRLLSVNLKTYLVDDLLVKMDRCSMAHGLEARSPFLDRALIEYVWTLPDRLKCRWGRTKVLLRRAFADLVPREILRRGKMGFGVPLEAWFASDLSDYLQDILLAPDARLKSYVNHAYVRELCEAHLRRTRDASHRIWTLLTFEVWLRGLPDWSTGRVGGVAQSGVMGAECVEPSYLGGHP